MEKAIIEVRPAVLSDLDGIMNVEKESFGEEVSECAMASNLVMKHRIMLVNQGPIKWFWVAVYQHDVVGYIVMQPTRLNPEDCVSWDGCTDNGLLDNTFDPNGSNIYGVSGGALNEVPGVYDILLHKLLVVWLQSRKHLFMLCSRMPGYEEMHERKGVKPEYYWLMKDRSGKPRDWMLRLYYECLGLVPEKFLPNGYGVDKKSGGHGVLCVGNDPTRRLDYLAERIYRAGFALGKQASRKAKG